MQSAPAFSIPVPVNSRKRALLPARTNSPKRSRVNASTSAPAHPSVARFRPKPFVPYISSNPHFQTIWTNFYPQPPPVHYTRVLLNTDDKQAVLKIDIANATSLAPQPTHVSDQPITVRHHTPPEHYAHLPRPPPVAVILHGLESNSSAVVTRRIVHAAKLSKYKAIVLNFRSCADHDDTPTTLRLYHAGFTEDVETLLRAIKEAAIETGWHPPDVYLCGFSLGSNLVCHFLGRQRENATSLYHVVAAAGACVPFDPTACQQKLDTGWRGLVYSRYLVETMQAKFETAYKMGVDIGEVIPDHIRRADRIGLIDEYFIAPVFQFKDRFDYYQQVDARKVLKHITVPTLLINARDDPFFDHATDRSLPTREQIGNAPVIVYFTEHGGHCGFLDKATFLRESPGYFQSEIFRFFSVVRGQQSVRNSRSLAETQSPDKL